MHDYDYFLKKTYPNYFNDQLIFLKAGIVIMILDILARGISLLVPRFRQSTTQERQLVKSGMIMRVEMLVMFVMYNLAQFNSGHKEDRFLMGIYPLMAVFIAYCVICVGCKLRLPLVATLILFWGSYRNVTIHYRDCYSIKQNRYREADWLRLYENKHQIKSLLYLGGCYPLPGNSHLHIKGGRVSHLDCNWKGNKEIIKFQNHPSEFIQMKLLKDKPTHIMMDRRHFNLGKSIIGKLGYRIVKTFETTKRRDNDYLFLENRYINDY